MTGTAKAKGPDRTGVWITYSIVMAGFAFIVLATGAMQAGEMAHDAFCPEHGWAV